MKFSVALVSAFAATTLGATIQSRQAAKLPWKKPGKFFVDCGYRGVYEDLCGTELFCKEIAQAEPADNPRGFKTTQECLDGHEPDPSKQPKKQNTQQCDEARMKAFQDCRSKKPYDFNECVREGQDTFIKCVQEGQDTSDKCEGDQ
ncbi:hypothetical protein J3458_019389 [Metarhizium acridum]|uniref:uncharacterized protein n=1 Tax=Metarhizium acridum TaxID=92637 RepID=UPI001C6CFE4B|nr:hypothetical protein J3458_019389 [Metarhizium acridum]